VYIIFWGMVVIGEEWVDGYVYEIFDLIVFIVYFVIINWIVVMVDEVVLFEL